jgi:two-component system cell cycle sensor histidine kinase PleC
LSSGRATPLLTIVFVVLIGIGIAGAVFLGKHLERQAYEHWRQNAHLDANRLTEIVTLGMDRARGFLRSVSVIFRDDVGVDDSHVDDTAFADAVARALNWDEPPIFRAVVYAPRVHRDGRPLWERKLGGPFLQVGEDNITAPDQYESFPVTLRANREPFLHYRSDLSSHAVIGEAVSAAYVSRERVSVSRTFSGPDGANYLAMAFATSSRGAAGVVVAIMDVNEFLDKILVLNAPAGFSVRLARRESGSGLDFTMSPLIGPLALPKTEAATFEYRIAYGLANWRINWDVRTTYANGPALAFANSVTYGGSVLAILVGAIIALLGHQNIRINRVVRQRTLELAHARDAAESANRAKSAFLATMSHELRTPLNVIIGFAEIISDRIRSANKVEQCMEYADDIRQSGTHLLTMINDILDLSKAEAGKLELQEDRVKVASIVAMCLRLMSDQADRATLDLRNELAHDPPDLYADERKVRQILLNLLSNAIKFTPTGGWVSVSGTLTASGDYCLVVADSGIGMAKEALPEAMAHFGQIDSSLQRNHLGTGLGLPLVKTLIELHGGSMEIESEPAKGTAITVVFPAERVLINQNGMKAVAS